VSQVFLRTGREIEGVGVGSKYSWEAAGSRERQQMSSGEDSAVFISIGALKLGT
jgi:hypothetical protein